jgi:hypothetical protein
VAGVDRGVVFVLAAFPLKTLRIIYVLPAGCHGHSVLSLLQFIHKENVS